jgi:hypothetical protein
MSFSDPLCDPSWLSKARVCRAMIPLSSTYAFPGMMDSWRYFDLWQYPGHQLALQVCKVLHCCEQCADCALPVSCMHQCSSDWCTCQRLFARAWRLCGSAAPRSLSLNSSCHATIALPSLDSSALWHCTLVRRHKARWKLCWHTCHAPKQTTIAVLTPHHCIDAVGTSVQCVVTSICATSYSHTCMPLQHLPCTSSDLLMHIVFSWLQFPCQDCNIRLACSLE